MVVNTHYRFVFVHVPKAAGTSVMNCLTGLPGNHQRWLADTKHETLSEFYAAASSRRTFFDRIRFRAPQDYFVFGFVRNPWDRMSSFYHYLVEKRPRPEIDTVSSFKDFLNQADEGVGWIEQLYAMKSQLEYFALPGDRLRADFLGHYEYLSDDFASVTDGLQCSVTLGHNNRSTNNRRDYRKEFDDTMVDSVARRFAREIALFGYGFENPDPSHRLSGRLNETSENAEATPDV